MALLLPMLLIQPVGEVPAGALPRSTSRIWSPICILELSLTVSVTTSARSVIWVDDVWVSTSEGSSRSTGASLRRSAPP